jgi:predicted DNA-binding protein with PD1-like motif
MRAGKLGGRYLLRLERGEEVLETLKKFTAKERLPGASLTGLGATDDVTVSFYDLRERIYRPYRRTGCIEILSLTGNIAWRGEEPIAHVHLIAAHETEGAFGGHLVSARVSATVEIKIEPYAARLERALVPEIGLPLLSLPPYPLD